jgi:hypothetical protein
MKLRSLFTDAEVLECLPTADETYGDMAQMLTNIGRCTVTRQLARYWARQFDTTKLNGDYYLTLTVANRELKNNRQLRVPQRTDMLAIEEQATDPECIMVFGDTHAPYHHTDAIDFLRTVRDAMRPTMVIHTGDEVDNHALSFHDSDPNLDSAGMELEASKLWIKDLELVFPELFLMESNHGSLAFRKAKAHGIPAAYIKTYRQVLFDQGGERWSWHHRLRLENKWGRDMQFQHIGNGDLMALAAHENANIIVGHMHTKFGIGYAASEVDTYWSMYTGWLGDVDALAFAYGDTVAKKPILGCGIIREGIPYLIPMRLDRHNRWTGEL